TFTFSEAVTGFTTSDIASTNGAITDLATTDNITWTATFTPTADTDGSANITVADNTYIDSDGNNGTGDSLEINVDTLIPVITINTIAGDDVIDDAEDNSVTISGTTTDVEDNQQVTVNIAGTDYFATVTGNSWSIPNIDLSSLPDGVNYSITADVNDVAGNSAVQAVRPISTIDTTAPTITISAIAGDDVIDDSEDDSVTISGTTVGVENGQQVTVNIDGTNYFATVTGNAWSIPGLDLSTLTDGTNFAITANVSDVAGNPAVQATRDISTIDSTAATTDDVNATGLEDTASIEIILSGSDVDGTVSSFNLDGLPANGSLYTDDTLTTLAATGVDYAAIGDQLTLYFVPDANWSGSADFDYTATDANGLTDATPATATINVTAVVDTPNLQVGLNESPDKVIFNDNFNDGNADGWNYVGFNGSTPNWYVSNGTLVEDSGTARGFLGYDTTQAGTGLDALDNYSISTDVGTTIGGSSASNDAVGLIFSYTDNQNYYMVRWNDYDSNYSGSTAHRDFELVSVVGGTSTVLDVLDQEQLPASFNLNVTVTQSGGINVYVDGTQMLSASANTPAIGTFGLWTDDNDTGVTYDNVRVTAIADGTVDVIAYEGEPLDFNIAASLTDIDNSEVLSTVVSGIEIGATLSDGTNNFTATAGNTSIDVSAWDQTSLTISDLASGSHSITVTSTSTEQSNNDSISTSQTLDIEVISVNDPVALDIVDSVMESGLVDGTAPDVNTITTTGNLLQGQAGSTLVEVDGNTAVGGVITIQSDSGTLEVYTQAGNYAGVDFNAGDYVYTLENSTTEGLNDTDQFIYTVESAAGTQTNGSLAINIVDDAPIGSDVTANIVDSDAAAQTTNLVIVLDRSGSMAWDLEGDQSGSANFNADQVRMDIAKDALSSMFDSFDDLGNVNIKFVDFSSNVNESQWYVDDKGGANDYLDGVTPGGGTNYDDALDATMAGFTPPTADTTLVYFISDGEPSSGHDVDAAQEANWESFVQANNIDISYGIGITGNVNLSSLQPIAFPDTNVDGDVDPYAIQVLDAFDLRQTLLDTVSEGVVQGDSSILTGAGASGIIMGADGGHIESIVIDGVTHSYVPVTNVVETITTSRGGTMEINYETGEYLYTINPQQTVTGEQEIFVITGVDGDGDTKAIDLTINLDYVANIDANRDNIITNAADGDSVDVSYDALMANDTISSTMNVTNVTPATGTDLSSDADSVTLTDVADGESFSYEISDASVSDSATVDVTLVDSDALVGTDGDDILINARTSAAPVANNFIDATVRSGDTFNQSNQIGFRFSDSLNGLSIAAITLDLRAGTDANAYFDTTGSGSSGPTIGADTTLNSADVSFNAPDNSATLTINFAANSFNTGDEFWFGVDTDNLGGNTGADFGNAGVGVQITLSDGSTMNGVYVTNADGSSEVAMVDGSLVSGGEGDDVLIGNTSDELLLGGEGNDLLLGGAGDDSLFGGSGVDILNGGSGNDSLTGGDGRDTFVWTSGDEGTAALPANDVITDFTLGAGGDVLDLADLLQGEDTGNLTDYLHFDSDGSGGTTISVDSDGGAVFETAQEITLTGVDLTVGGTLTDQQILDGLLADGNLIVDY
ncbi:MAG: type I secretion C-terminal target domain-containing protein, partial [Gammaproteobacteria bacterium]|nr:type I secretion C-terminal target domain-containing protein [Gammaproteobacteria bacterium]